MNKILLNLPAPIACHSEWVQLLRTLLRQVLMLKTWRSTVLQVYWA